MDNSRFNDLLANTIQIVTSTLSKKASEYAGPKDRLHNFKIAASLANSTPEMALRGMMAKHIVSVWDLVQDRENEIGHHVAIWDEKLIDSINYLILLRALVHEEEPIESPFQEVKP